jgi:hypothetical protein
MPRYTFHHVEITVSAPTAKDAYTILCNGLEALPGVEYQTDYFTDDDYPGDDHSTGELQTDD